MSHENSNWSQQVWQQPQQAAAPAQPQADMPYQPQASANPQACQQVNQQPRATSYASHAQGYAPAYAAAAPMPAGSASAQAPKKHGWVVALVAVILAFVLMLFGVASCTSALTSFSDPLDSLTGGSYFSEADMLVDDAIAIIEIAGTIQYDGTTCSPEGLKEQLDIAELNPHIKAVVLRIDSGGGTATAGEEMSLYVREFSKPIVVSSASLNASAAYEISSQTDYIFTAKTTAIGSIGTAMQITDLSGLYDKLGISIENITSSESKDSSYGTRGLTDEERAHYQNMVDQINETFIQAVAEGRGMSVEAVRELATGLTFTGMDAVENGLADEIGTLEDAVEKAAELSGASDYTTLYLYPDYGYDLYSLLGFEAASKLSTDDAALLLKELEDGSLAH